MLALDQFVARLAVLLALLGVLLAAPLAHAAPPTEPLLLRAAPPTVLNARPADDALAIKRGLTRAVEAKRLTRAQAARYREILSRSRTTLTGLPSTRRITLANVLRLVRLQASRFNAPRALALFSMLDMNARYLKRRALPAAGTDVTGPDGVVYRSGWGYGLQFHPLANMVRLNVDAAAGRTAKTARLAAALVARAVPRKEGRVWEYYFPYGGGSPPWTAEMPQAVGAQALSRAGRLLKRPTFYTAARRAFRAIQGTSLLMSTGNGPWVRHYSFSSMMVLNAQLQSVDLAHRVRRDRGQRSRPGPGQPARGECAGLARPFRHRVLDELHSRRRGAAQLPPVPRRPHAQARQPHRPRILGERARSLRGLHPRAAAHEAGQEAGVHLPVAGRRIPRPGRDRLLGLEDLQGHRPRRGQQPAARPPARRLASRHLVSRDGVPRGRTGRRRTRSISPATPPRTRFRRSRSRSTRRRPM